MIYNIDLGRWGKIFAVPNCVVEDYIKLASGSAIKVLLYLLYNNPKNVSTEEIAVALNIPTESVDDAFCFWEEVSLLKKNEIRSQDICDVPTEVIEIPQMLKVPIQQKQKSTGSLTPKEIAERIENSQEIAFLFSAAEASFSHILTHTEQRSLIWMHDYLGLPADVILMLFEYCKIINKTNVRYIETIAISWQEKEILTHEAAENEIQNLKSRHTLSTKVLSAFGINRNLSSKEEAFIAEWTAKNYDIDLICYAYDKTIDSINKLSFPYINKIITDWYSKGLLTKEQIDKENEAFPKSNSSAKEHSYDLDKFDTLALSYTTKAKIERNDNE